MDILEIIKQRRSVREYTKQVPCDEDIEKILDAGRWAPSGLNNQPWRLKIIKDTSQKDALSKYTKYADIIKSAAIVIVVCINASDSYNWDKDVMATGACIQNMCLQAHALGLGTCWLGEILNKKQQVQDYLELDEDLNFIALITLGSPSKKITKSSRKSLNDLII